MTHQTRRQFLITCAAGIYGAHRAFGQTPASAFSFATINDCHIKDAASTAIVERAVARINGDARIQFAVVLGDAATGGAREELDLAKTAFDKFTCPWYIVPGNHDVAPRDPDIRANFTAVFGPVHWVHEHQGWALIGFDSCEGAKSDVTVAEPELAWLREQAEALKPEQPVALFCHHPLNPHTAHYRILNADTILDIFKGRPLRIAAAGHWHGNQVEEQGGTLFATTACCSFSRNNFDKTEARGYRLFHIKDGAVETEFVEVPLESTGA